MARFRTLALMGLATAIALIGGSVMARAQSPLIVRMAELEIDPAQLEAYRSFLKEEIETSVRVEPGVLSLNAVAVKGSPNQIRILEIYSDQAAYEAHLKAPHFLKYKTGTAGMDRTLHLLEADPISLCAKTIDGSHCR